MFLTDIAKLKKEQEKELLELPTRHSQKLAEAEELNSFIPAFLESLPEALRNIETWVADIKLGDSYFKQAITEDYTITIKEQPDVDSLHSILGALNLERLNFVKAGCSSFVPDSKMSAYVEERCASKNNAITKQETCAQNYTIRIASGALPSIESLGYIYLNGKTIAVKGKVSVDCNDFHVSTEIENQPGFFIYKSVELTKKPSHLFEKSIKWGSIRTAYVNDFSVY